jgi:hypothetical protein
MIAFYAKAQWTTSGSNIYNANSGNVGIGTSNPKSKLHVLGPGLWDLSTSEGDFKIGNDTFRLKMGVALAGGGAGDCYIAAQGKTSATLYLGTANSLANIHTLSVQDDGKVGIGNTNPFERFSTVSLDNLINTNIASFFSNDQKRGIGIGFNTIRAIGTTAKIDLRLQSKGVGSFIRFLLGNTEVANFNEVQDLQIDQANTNNGTNTGGALRFGFASGEAIASKRTSGGNQYGLDFYAGGGPVPRMSLTNAGNFGIGTSSPGNKLVVSNNTTSDPTVLIQNLFNPGGNIYADGLYIQAGNNDGSGISYYADFLRPDGSSIGTISQNDANSVGYNTTSDKRLKTNIHETKYGLADVKKIQVRDFNFINSKVEQTGFIAQQLYEVFPEAVAVGGQDANKRPWMVDYGRVTPLLVKAIQEQQQQIDKQQTQIDELKQLVKNLTQNLPLSSNSNSDASVAVPGINNFKLDQNIPNPLTNTATISYSVPQNTKNVQLVITTNSGSPVRQFKLTGGNGTVNVDASSLSSGTYNYALIVDGKIIGSKKLVVAH